MTRRCPDCLNPRRVLTLDDGITPIGLAPCINDYCNIAERTRKEKAENAGRVAAVCLGLVLTAAFFGIRYSVSCAEERWVAEQCEGRGGEWFPVRDWTGWPTGRGVCEVGR